MIDCVVISVSCMTCGGVDYFILIDLKFVCDMIGARVVYMGYTMLSLVIDLYV